MNAAMAKGSKKKSATKSKVSTKKVAAIKAKVKSTSKSSGEKDQAPRKGRSAIPSSKGRAAAFRATRKSRSMEAADDYTELVQDLIDDIGEARICNLAKELGVSHVTALRTVRRLQEEGYLETSPHKPVTLTVKGKKTAKEAKSRHDLVLDFLKKLGVPEKIAEVDAEGIEHHVSPLTLKIMKKYIDK
jgi:DtxR family transcriptional regulator, manganese transport regulator